MALVGLNVAIEGLDGSLILRWKAASNPLAEVGRTAAVAFPVDQIYNLPDLAPVVYIVEFWRSVDGVALSEFIRAWDVDASKEGVYKETTYEYVCDRGHSGAIPGSVWADPTNLEGFIRDERLLNEAYHVSSRGTGRYRTDEITDRSDLGGGFDMADLTFTFGSGDSIFVTVLNKETIVATPGSTGDYADVNQVSGDGDFDSTFYKKINVGNGEGTILKTTFPDFALIPNTKARFEATTGSQRYWTLQFAAGNTIIFQGTARNKIHLAKGDCIELFWKDGYCYGFGYIGEYAIVGQAVLTNTPTLLNAHLADGTESDIADYVRLIEALVPEQIVTYADALLTTSVTVGNKTKLYYINKGKFAVNTGTGKFKWPDMRGYSLRVLNNFVGTTDLTRLSQGGQSVQAQELIEHRHPAAVWNENGNGQFASGGNYFEANILTMGLAGGLEQRVDNIAQYAQIKY